LRRTALRNIGDEALVSYQPGNGFLGVERFAHLARPLALAHHARFKGDWVTGASSKVNAQNEPAPTAGSS
jgi:hypothetical protein